MYTLDDFQQAGNHLRYLVLLLWYTSAPPYRHCTLIKLLWAKVALFEHDLTMDALLENAWSK